MARIHRALVVLVGLIAAGFAAAQGYPERPVTMVVPYAAGGAGDILARLLGAAARATLGQASHRREQAGRGRRDRRAGGRASAAPDGYTLMIAPSPVMAVNVTLYKSLAYDPAADFVPLALVAQTPFVLVVNPNLPIRSVAELIASWKRCHRTPDLLVVDSGPGVPHHLFAELFKTMTGIEMSPVAYRGSAPALTDVVAGHVPLMFVDLGPSLALIRDGKVRALGVSTGTRVAAIGDVPTIARAGVAGFDAASWQMIAAPAKTPAAIVDKLHADLETLVATPEVKEQILANGMLPMENKSVAGLQDFIKAKIARWGKVVQQAGIAGSL